MGVYYMKWISVKDKFPKEGKLVLAWSEFGMGGFYVARNNAPWRGNSGWEMLSPNDTPTWFKGDYAPTYWMKIVRPPKESIDLYGNTVIYAGNLE